MVYDFSIRGKVNLLFIFKTFLYKQSGLVSYFLQIQVNSYCLSPHFQSKLNLTRFKDWLLKHGHPVISRHMQIFIFVKLNSGRCRKRLNAKECKNVGCKHNLQVRAFPNFSHFLHTCYGRFFEMAVMPFPCNGLMLCCVN